MNLKEMPRNSDERWLGMGASGAAAWRVDQWRQTAALWRPQFRSVSMSGIAQPVRETNTGYVTSNVWQELKVGNKRLRPGLPMLIRARRREFPRDDADGGRI